MKFNEIIGNKNTKTQLLISASAAINKNSSIPHSLFEGAPGTGKTTISKSLAELLQVPFIQEDPTSIKETSDVYRIIQKFPKVGYDANGKIIGKIYPPVLFLDEIHNLSLKGQELLGLAMENWEFPITIRNKKQVETRNIFVPRFTLVGATTLVGKLSKPFRDRFKLSFKFQTYELIESIKVLLVHADLRGIEIDPEAAVAIAKIGRGTPRLLVRFLERAIDFSLAMKKSSIDLEVIESLCYIAGVDKNGLTREDIKLLKCLYENKATTVGIDSLSVLLNEAPSTIAHEIEPYLIQKGLIVRTSKGRVLTESGENYIQTMFSE